MAMYFSPTRTTQKVVHKIAEVLAEKINNDHAIQIEDFTLPGARAKITKFTESDIVIVGVPVYAARVPNVLLKHLQSITGNGALAIAVTVYGNRNYDDALIELYDILTVDGFKVVAAGAFIGEHSFSKTLAAHRPDTNDLEIAETFAKQITEKIICQKDFQAPAVKGNRPYRYYYIPKDTQNNPVDIRKVKPKTNDACTNCLKCVSVCPMGSIRKENVKMVEGICIKCGACVKICPVQAKYYDDASYLYHKEELEVNFSCRKEPEVFL